MKLYKYSVGAMGTNCYLAVDEATKEAAVIDPGGDYEKIAAAIAAKDCHVSAILLTHAHFDHLLALEPLRKLTGAPLYVHAADAPFLSDNTLNLMQRFSGETLTIRPPEQLLHDGDTVAVGQEAFTVIHTPGHTPGSVCFLNRDTIVTGDTLFRESIGRYDFPGGDYATILSSLGKLVALGQNGIDYRLCPGHGPSTHLNYEKEHNLYLN
ncbi:MAG: MBL fold metallo-hydrolase [Ruminococcaceae bacterium]|nr:MBL fold metallo-hydrolase [Oscillospiraceae bacterium]